MPYLIGGFALLTLASAVYVWSATYRVHNRLNIMEDTVQSVRGKVQKVQGLTREEVRDACDAYLSAKQNEQPDGGDSGLELLLPMMMQMQQGAEPEPSAEEPRSQEPAPSLLGHGGSNA